MESAVLGGADILARIDAEIAALVRLCGCRADGTEQGQRHGDRQAASRIVLLSCRDGRMASRLPRNQICSRLIPARLFSAVLGVEAKQARRIAAENRRLLFVAQRG